MNIKRTIGILAIITLFTSVYGQYTETMDPDGLTKNMKDDYGLVDDNAATNQSAKLRTAISDLNALGGGRIIIPKGTYRISDITLMSDIHILIEAGTIIKPATDEKKIFLFSTPTGNGPDFIENVSVRGIGGPFIVDYHTLKAGIKQRAILAKMVRNFLISDMCVKDNYSTHCGITLTSTSESGDISDWEVSRATDGTIRNIKHFRAHPGYGLVQVHGAQSVYFENLYSIGGVTLRLESGANVMHVGLYDLTAKNITNRNGRSAVMMGPHSAKNGVVTVDSVLAISSSCAVQFGDGGVKEDAPDQTPGYFSDSSSVTNIHAVFGKYSQVKGAKFLAIPTTDYYDDMKIWSDDKFFDAPSIGAVFDNAQTYTVNIENVTMEGFEYYNDKPILKEYDYRAGSWGTEKTGWINSHQGEQWETFKGVIVKDYNIEDYINSAAPTLSQKTLNIYTYEDNSTNLSLADLIDDPDVDPLPVSSVYGPTNGSIVITGSEIEYSPDPNFYGLDTIVYEVCDYETPSMCSQGSIIVNINSINDSPLVLGNSNTLYLGIADTTTCIIPVSDSLVADPEGDILTVSIDRDPANGSAIVDSGIITYIPNSGFDGKDTINYSACDSGEPVLCASGSIIITVTSIPQDTLSIGATPINPYNIRVYPNPAKNLIHIEGEKIKNKAVNLSLFDLAGKEVTYKNGLKTSGNSLSITIPELPGGYYSLRLSSENGQIIGFSKVVIL